MILKSLLAIMFTIPICIAKRVFRQVSRYFYLRVKEVNMTIFGWLGVAD